MKKTDNRVKRLFNSCKSSSNKGFTLVELLVAIVVLSLVVVPTMSVFVAATKSNSKARTELQATITASSVMESAKAYSLYVFDKQCNTVYTDSNASDFTLLAGTTTESFVSSSYGGSAGVVTFEGTKVKSVSKRDSSVLFTERDSSYAFALNGIKQSNSVYDALIIYEEEPYRDVEVMGEGIEGHGIEYSEGDVATDYTEYNKAYNITVYVYKHDAVSPEYIGKDLAVDSGALVELSGSKIDTAIRP
ncbi:MAG: prepilin-type N-terminal cleavage/methylation domain-containing protein [Lachnospiraceae bacterium]